MARDILILWAGRHQRQPWEELCAEYRQRLQRDVRVQDRPIKVRAGGSDPRRCELEGQALLAALPEPCWSVALDAGGRSMSSEKLAGWLAERREAWPHPLAFVIGSDLGHSAGLLGACRETLSLGPLTFGHELARLVLYEQLYRSFAISKGINYHRPSF